MKMVTKIACRTVGIAGMGVALFDATQVGKMFAGQGAMNAGQKHLERAYFNARSIDEVSFNKNNIRKKVFDMRTKNPLHSIFGRIKGGTEGFLYGLGNMLPLVLCSSFAIASKNIFAKAGAIGTGCIAVYNILRNGFGLGKQHPMD